MGLESYVGIGKPDEKKEIRVESSPNNIIFEQKAVYWGYNNSRYNKKLYRFDESLVLLKQRGYERHPRPAEVFNLLCKGLEGGLPPEQLGIVEDILNNYPEWYSAAMRRKGNFLYYYLDPENIFWNGRSYGVKGGKLRHSGKEVYNIQSLSHWISIKDLNKVNSELVEVLWSRPYALLPNYILQKAWIYLPLEEGIWPVCRGFDYHGVGCYVVRYGASRGVLLG